MADTIPPLENAAYAKALQTLAEAGLSATLNRILVLMALTGSGRPLAAKEVFEAVNAEHKLNPVTVYRILDLFAERMVANKITSGERDYRYCARPGRHMHEHCHFHCTECGQVQCIDIRSLPFDLHSLEHLSKDGHSLDIRNIEVRLDGICQACKGRRTADAG